MHDLTDPRLIALTFMSAGYVLGALLPAVAGILGKGRVKSPAALDGLVKNLGFTIALASSLAGCVLSLSILLSGDPLDVEIQQSIPFGMMTLHADRLSAFFLGVISLIGAAVSVYSLGYAAELPGRRDTGLLVFLYNLFLLSMAGVVLSGHAFLFLFFWEGMSLTTYFLINYEHEDPAARRAAYLYVVMAHIGTALLVIMFVILFCHTGSFSFGAFRDPGSRLPGTVQSLVFLCATIGFGVKAGVIPFHIWLPEAHPAAPSNISALMSGVMIKMGIYGMVRVYFDFLGPDIPEWWGILILIVAVTSSVLGVLYALMEHDLKRLLAFHSIENIGIILMGVGGALLFASLGDRPLASLALLAGLYHVLNHATFKGLLFLGAGSVFHATHTRNIEELGGLIKKLPWTALFFLIGAVAISALPPLNGFVSEWLTFQALLLGFHLSDLTVKIAVPLTVALLALTGALAAACFVKAFGITFLGLPRSPRAEGAHESSFSMIAAMGSLALLCVVFGLAPGLVVSVLDPLVGSLPGTNASGQVVLTGGTMLIPQSNFSSVSPLALAGLIIAVTMIPLAAGFLLGGRMRKRVVMTWACGLQKIEPRMQYTATGFSKPIRMIFSNIFRATHEIEISEETSPYFHPDITYELKTESLFLKYLYEPAYRIIIGSARMFRRVQTGHIQTYLAYIFVTLVLLLLFAR
jgi:hydrogenase-4 component B